MLKDSCLSWWMTGDDWISRRFPHWHKIRGSLLSIVRPHKFGITLLKNWPFHLGDINALKMQNLTLILILFTNLWQHHIPVKWPGGLFWNYHWGIISTIFHRKTNEKVYTFFFISNSIFRLSLEMRNTVINIAESPRDPLSQLGGQTSFQSKFFHWYRTVTY